MLNCETGNVDNLRYFASDLVYYCHNYGNCNCYQGTTGDTDPHCPICRYLKPISYVGEDGNRIHWSDLMCKDPGRHVSVENRFDDFGWI